MKKPTWVVQKEREKRAAAAETFWLFGIHAVRDALLNPNRQKLKLIITPNAKIRLDDVLVDSDVPTDVVNPRDFKSPLDAGAVHQGAVLEVKALNWGPLDQHIMRNDDRPPRLVLLDRVSDPHNVGAILRSAEVFGASAVIGVARHAAPETGALAKTASGALERQPYLRVRNLAETMITLQKAGYFVIGLDGEATSTISDIAGPYLDRPVAIVLGAEGPGLRDRTKETCDALAKLPFSGDFGSLNVSNAAAVALYAIQSA